MEEGELIDEQYKAVAAQFHGNILSNPEQWAIY